MFSLLASQDLVIDDLNCNPESAHELFRWNEAAADRDWSFRKQEAAVLTEGLPGVRIRYGLGVIAELKICGLLRGRCHARDQTGRITLMTDDLAFHRFGEDWGCSGKSEE